MTTKHVVFLIHGMGVHDRTWPDEGLKVLRSAWSEYDDLSRLEFDEYIKPVPVVYDDVFETWRQEMKKDFVAFKSALLGGIADEDTSKKLSIEKQIDKAGKWIGAGEPEFLWTHAMDVILYRYFTLMRLPADISVYHQFLKGLSENPGSDWSIVGHSLGTSVAHNVLNTMYTTGLNGDPPVTTQELRPRLIMMVANVSRVLQRPGAKVFETAVRPGPPNGGAICKYYINVRHQFDPFTFPRSFEPDPDWPSSTIHVSDKYQHIRPAHIHFERNDLGIVHNFAHYMKNPRVNAEVFRCLIDRTAITDDELREKNRDFDSSVVSTTLDQARSKLESISPAVGSGLDIFLNLFKKVF